MWATDSQSYKKNFFDTGRMPCFLDQTFIVLIPKIKQVGHITDFKPISLCNFTYKVISKI